MPTLYLPELLYTDGAFRPETGLLVADDGTIQRIGKDFRSVDAAVLRMPGRALLPGLVNGHSHTFQRLIRGVAEHRGPNGDDFWAWRNKMYAAASSLAPEDLFDVARMAFLEMALSGITAVGEFHYVHRQPNGTAYEDPNLLAKTVIAAARSVGLRICLLRVAYERAGYGLEPNPGQKRFYESCEEYLSNAERLAEELGDDTAVSMGVAPHSVRAVPFESLRREIVWADEHGLPVHIHAAEQTAEIDACRKEHGCSPIQLLERGSLLSSRTTLVHAIHTTADEVEAMARTGATICSCPTTERNLGDGIIDADEAIAQGISFSFGTDSQATINLLEDARELDYHLRLKRQRRVLLDGIGGEEMSMRLFRYATEGGARSLGLRTGVLETDRPADFFTVDLHDVSIAGASAEELLPALVFSLERSAIRDVAVGGHLVVRDGHHALEEEIVMRYEHVARQTGSGSA